MQQDHAQPAPTGAILHTIAVEWRHDPDDWRASWWLSVDGKRPFPIGGSEYDDPAKVRKHALATYIGESPPDDHSKIWGGYTCAECNATDVRLWRDYQTVLDGQTLRCRSCCMDHEGKTDDDLMRTDAIGWSVPAVPTADGSTFWGYTSVPLAAADWWRSLPIQDAALAQIGSSVKS